MTFGKPFWHEQMEEVAAVTAPCPVSFIHASKTNTSLMFSKPPFALSELQDDYIKFARPNGWVGDSIIDFYVKYVPLPTFGALNTLTADTAT